MATRSVAAPRLVPRQAGLVRKDARRHRVGLWRYVLGGDLATLLTAPLIYSVSVPFVLLDAWVTLYQVVCFRAWGIRRVRRRTYFVIDRHKLEYLNGAERLHCLYCSYANGVIAYVREVAARTEQYWCPIRHSRAVQGAHDRYDDFADYGAAREYRQRLPLFRSALKR
jgi:hypothetical protein